MIEKKNSVFHSQKTAKNLFNKDLDVNNSMRLAPSNEIGGGLFKTEVDIDQVNY